MTCTVFNIAAARAGKNGEYNLALLLLPHSSGSVHDRSISLINIFFVYIDFH